MKYKVLLLTVICLIFSSVAMAGPHWSTMALGGVNLGMGIPQVEKIYGPPTRIYDSYSRMIGNLKVYSYNDSAKFCENENGDLVEIIVSKDNGFKTPEGIHVGSTYNDLLNAYGEPSKIDDPVEYTYTYNPNISDLQNFGAKEYLDLYHGKSIVYYNSNGIGYYFAINPQGIVTSMAMGILD